MYCNISLGLCEITTSTLKWTDSVDFTFCAFTSLNRPRGLPYLSIQWYMYNVHVHVPCCKANSRARKYVIFLIDVLLTTYSAIYLVMPQKVIYYFLEFRQRCYILLSCFCKGIGIETSQKCFQELYSSRFVLSQLSRSWGTGSEKNLIAQLISRLSLSEKYGSGRTMGTSRVLL